MREIDALPIPQFDFAAIKARAERPRSPRRRLFGIAFLSVLVPALAAAAALKFLPVTVTHIGGWYQIRAQSMKMTWKADSRTFADYGKGAPYRVTWPAGLPQQTKLQSVISTSSEVFVVTYRCAPKRQSRKVLWFVIIPHNYAAINPRLGDWLRDPHTFDHHTFTTFPAGDELVRLETNCLSATQIARVRSAMIAAGAAQR